MYCPKCSQEQVFEEVKFCSRCGFQLNAVKELLTSDATQTANINEPHEGSNISRQRDVILGAMMMLAGVALAAASTGLIAGPPTVWIGGALTVFTAALIFILLFSHPLMRALFNLFVRTDKQNVDPPRRSDMNLGALTMFTATLVSIFITLFFGVDNTTRLFQVSAISFIFTLLVSNRLPKAFDRLFSEGGMAAESVLRPADARNPALPPILPPMRSIPLTGLNGQSRSTAEIVQPPTITEHTTTLLDKS
ncbi:MAG: zinc ribbon domain-containing protein [Acidobacteriota bacterium]